MIITKALSVRMKKALPKNYRQQIVDRLKLKGKECHPNTVSNVLNGSNNADVALELLNLYNEHREVQKQLHEAKEAAQA